MAARSLQDQVDSLLSQQTVVDRSQGRQSVELEATALLESVAATLLLNPRVVLYFAHLARNGLANVLQQEVAAVAALRQTVQDLGNTPHSISDTSALERARVALIQFENGTGPSVPTTYRRFNKATSDFLAGELSKNVRRKGSTSLVRPATEAAIDLSSDLQSVKDLHVELLKRLFALAVGVRNFEASPLSSNVSSQIVSRSREDIEELIASFQEDQSGVQSRDAVVRLIAARAALKLLADPPKIDDPVISTAAGLPAGYVLQGASPPVPATAQTTVGPFAPSGSMTIETDGELETASPVVDAGFFSLVTEPISFPVTVLGNTHLFFNLTASVLRVPLNSTALTKQMSLSDVVQCLNAYGFGAAEFGWAGSGRLVIGYNQPFAVAASCSEPLAGTVNPVFYNRSAHTQLGMRLSQAGAHGVSAALVAEALNHNFDLIIAVPQPDGSVVISAKTAVIGSRLEFSGAWAGVLGLQPLYVARSDRLLLTGTTPDGTTPSPTMLLQPGDLVSTPTGSATVITSRAEYAELSTELQTFVGPITVTSGLLLAWQKFGPGVRDFLLRHKSDPFSKGLAGLDAAVSTLSGSATPAQRGRVSVVLDRFSAWLTDLSEVLLNADSQLPAGGGEFERRTAEAILEALEERKYDRAADMLRRCQVSEVFDLDYQTLSFAGNLLKASSALARTDFSFPNRSKDEGLRATSSRRGG
jgi:hypothetical protein